MNDQASLRGWPKSEVWLMFWMGRTAEDRDQARQELLRRGIVHRVLDWHERSPERRTAG